MKKRTKKQIEMDFAFFIVAISLMLFACVGFEEHVKQEKEIVPTLSINETIKNITEEPKEIIEIEDPCEGYYGTERTLCLAINQNNYSICKNDECLLEFAKNKSNEEACNQITLEVDKYICLSIVRGYEACTLAESKSGRNKCLAEYANYTGDESLCEKIIDQNSDYLKNCYLAIAIKEMSRSKCKFNSLGESAQKDECRREYARLTKDVSCCEYLWIDSWENDCYRQSAFDNLNPSLCNRIKHNYDRWQCYQGILNRGYPKEIEECKKISDIEWVGKCITNIAVLQNDSSLCNQITTELEKRNCELKFE